MRLQIEVTEQEVKAITELKTSSGLKTNKDLFDYALSVFDWIIAETKSGRTIASIDKEENVVRELVLPIFSKIR